MPVTTRKSNGADAPTVRPRKMVGRIGPWQLIRLIGESYLSRVYEARPADAPDSQPASYAVKSLRRDWWNDSAAIETFRREAWLGGRVSHPNVIPVLSAQVAHPPFYVVMPRLDGSPASELIRCRGALPVAEALWIARQAVEGMAAVYDATRMMHGDVKPANMLVAPSGHTTLIDLGFARTCDEAADRHSHCLAASMAYAAPELLTSSYAASPQSDLYSLGVALYELLTGRLPFDADDPGELVSQHRTASPACIRSLLPDLPKRIASLVHSLLSKTPLRRAASYRDVADRLVRLEIEAFGTRVATPA